jgi:adenylate cyclase
MREAGAKLKAEYAAQGIHFGRTRIGLHSGAAVVGNVGGQRRFDYTAIGDVVNTASRLCSVAGAGEILISSSTYELVKDYFEAQELSPTQVKGKAQALQVYRVLGEKSGRRR